MRGSATPTRAGRIAWALPARTCANGRSTSGRIERLTRHMPALLGVGRLGCARRLCARARRHQRRDGCSTRSITQPWWHAGGHRHRACDGLAELHAVWLWRDASADGPAVDRLPASRPADDRDVGPVGRARRPRRAGRSPAGAAPICRLCIAAWSTRSATGGRDLDDGPHDAHPQRLQPAEHLPAATGGRRRAVRVRLGAGDARRRRSGISRSSCASCCRPRRRTRPSTRWVERHRAGARAGRPGVAVDRRQWRRGFARGAERSARHRLAMYALVHRVRPQAFLPRVLVASWRRLHECAGRRMAA